MEARAGSKRTILIVDDDPSVLKFVSDVLNQEQYQILVADSGEAALQQEQGYDGEIELLLSDFQMPGMSGIDLATKMTQLRPKIKVLLMSGFKGGMLVLNEGWHFLPKPFVPSQLRALVVGLLFPEQPSGYVQGGSHHEPRRH